MAGFDMRPLDRGLDDPDQITVTVSWMRDSEIYKRAHLRIHKESRLGYLREEIYSKLGEAVEYQSITFQNESLDDTANDIQIDEIGITDGAAIDMISTRPPRPPHVSYDVRASSSTKEQPENAGLIEEKKQEKIAQKKRTLKGGTIQENPIPKPECAKYLQKWSLIQCRAIIVFVEIFIILFVLAWGYWSMVYYLMGVCFSVVGWLGCRRLSTKYIFFFCVFLFLDVIIMLDSLITSAENKEAHGYGTYGVFIFLLSVEMIIMLTWMATLIRFGYIIHTIKKESPVTVAAASKFSRAAVICV